MLKLMPRIALILTTAAIVAASEDGSAQTYTNPNSVISDLMCPTSKRPDTPDGSTSDPTNNIQALTVGVFEADCWVGPSWINGTTHGRGRVTVVSANQIKLRAYLFGNAASAPRKARVWGYNTFGLINGCIAEDNSANNAYGTERTYNNGDTPVGCSQIQSARVVVYNHT